MRAIKSVLAQDYQDLEILVIDDGSEQHHRRKIQAIVNAFNDPRITLIHHAENCNGAAARNTGIQAAKGDFICFLDSDDEWLPAKLNVMYQAIQSANTPVDDIIIHHPYVNIDFGKKGKPYPKLAKQVGESVAHYSFVTNNVGGIQSSTLCVAASLAKYVMFNEQLRGHQDWDFALRLGAHTDRFIFVEQTLSLRHRDGSDSVAKSLDWRYSLGFLKQYKRFFEAKTATYFFERVVLKKAIKASSLLPLLLTRTFWWACWKKPSILFSMKKWRASRVQLCGRIERLLEHCRTHQHHSIILWGANAYSLEIVNATSNDIKVLAIIDNGLGDKSSALEGIPIRALNTMDASLLERAHAIVLVTDHHCDSMKQDLAEKNADLLVKVVNF